MSKEEVVRCFYPRGGEAVGVPWISKSDIVEAFGIVYDDVDEGVLGQPGPPGPPGTPMVMALLLGD